MGKLTIREVETLPDKTWRSDGTVGAARMGTLVFRREGNAIHGYFRYAIGRTTKVHRIGLFDKTGKRGMSLAELRDRAAALARLRQEGALDLAAHFAALEEEQHREREAARQAEEAARAAQEARAAAAHREAEARDHYTLKALVEAYTTRLEAQGKAISAGAARSTFKCHLLQPFTDLCSTPARDVTALQLAAVIRQASQSGKVRTAGILRALLHAAYNLALKAPLSADIGPEFLGFEIALNPVAAIPTLPTNTRDRVLTDAELSCYLRHLFGSRLAYDLFLLMQVLTAGQRIQQLLRVTEADWNPLTNTLRLKDPKGRRKVPREHLLPLASHGAELALLLLERARHFAGPASTPGRYPLFLSDLVEDAALNVKTVGDRCKAIAEQECGSKWTLGDIRRSAETRLAGLGVSRDIRAQLLSHGLGDLQTRHYDRHGWTQEKRAALELWESHLDSILTKQPE